MTTELEVVRRTESARVLGRLPAKQCRSRMSQISGHIPSLSRKMISFSVVSRGSGVYARDWSLDHDSQS
eukprot:35333-Eustigmatos_ZCMA.PRE.1